MIEVQPYGPQWEQAHIAFASKYWTKSRRKIPEYIYWKFRGVPQQGLSSFLLAVENNQVVGQLGLLPVNVVIEGATYTGQWACDLMVDTAYRGAGVAKLLYQVAHQQKPITIGSDPSPAASGSMQKNGYELIPASWKYIFPMHLNEVTQLKGINHSFLKNIPNPFLIILRIHQLFSSNSFQTVDFSILDNHPIHEYKQQFAFVARDSDFVKWRFEPFQEYYPGVELRLDPQQRFYSGYFANNSYYLMDYWIESRLDFLKILADISNRFKRKGLTAIRFFSLDEQLQFFGSIRFRTRSEIIYFTNSNELKKKFSTKTFFYTYADSDENI